MREGYLATTYYRGSMHKDNMQFFDTKEEAIKYVDKLDWSIGNRCVWHLTKKGAKQVYNNKGVS